MTPGHHKKHRRDLRRISLGRRRSEGAATGLALLAGALTDNALRSNAGHRPRCPESPNTDAFRASVIPQRHAEFALSWQGQKPWKQHPTRPPIGRRKWPSSRSIRMRCDYFAVRSLSCNKSRSCCRALATRDITVPTGTPRIPAVSL